MTSKFFTQTEAEKAITEFFQARNAARGQYPQRVNAKRTLRNINDDGTVLYGYSYKGEQAEMLWGPYYTMVTFAA